MCVCIHNINTVSYTIFEVFAVHNSIYFLSASSTWENHSMVPVRSHKTSGKRWSRGKEFLSAKRFSETQSSSTSFLEHYALQSPELPLFSRVLARSKASRHSVKRMGLIAARQLAIAACRWLLRATDCFPALYTRGWSRHFTCCHADCSSVSSLSRSK